MTTLTTILADAYLDYLNNFLTVERFTSYYGLESLTDAHQVLALGKKYHEQRVRTLATGPAN